MNWPWSKKKEELKIKIGNVANTVFKKLKDKEEEDSKFEPATIVTIEGHKHWSFDRNTRHIIKGGIVKVYRGKTVLLTFPQSKLKSIAYGVDIDPKTGKSRAETNNA